MLDGVVLSRKTGAGALKRPVLWPWGRSDARRRSSTFAWPSAEWEQFLTDLFRRGLEGGRLEMVCVDGAAASWPPCPCFAR